MTAVRFLCCALALAGCATPARTVAPTAPTYRLCADPAFEGLCTPASMPTPATELAPIQVDTNLKAPSAAFPTRLG